MANRAYGSKSNPPGPGSARSPPTPPPLEDCGDNGQCAGYYPPSTVVLKATPQPHSKIDGWTGCDGRQRRRRRMQRRTDQREPEGLRELHPAAANCHRRDRGHRHRLGQRRQRARRDPGLRRRPAPAPAPTTRAPQIELLATPTGHSTFTGWSGDCTNQTGPVPARRRRRTLGHRPLHRPACGQRQKGRNAAPARVVSEPGGLDCGGVCVGFFTDGESVTLSAVPSGHSTFTGWSGRGCSGTDACEVEVGESTKTVTATFAHDTPDVVTEPGRHLRRPARGDRARLGRPQRRRR